MPLSAKLDGHRIDIVSIHAGREGKEVLYGPKLKPFSLNEVIAEVIRQPLLTVKVETVPEIILLTTKPSIQMMELHLWNGGLFGMHKQFFLMETDRQIIKFSIDKTLGLPA